MRLLFSATSPYARKVRVLILEKGLADRVESVPTNPLEDPPALSAVNPLHKVPALLLDDGQALYDSPLICEYLDVTFPTPRFIPEAGAERWRVLKLQALADGILDAALPIVMELRRPETERSAAWLERWQRAITRGVAVADADHSALDGPLDLGQVALVAALDYLDFRLPDLAWQDRHPELAAWHRALLERPSLRATDPRG
ncbi:glutathione S-transferase N-terminal domain-containing protein [Novispirillum sp. DQ9]|uniref:glutathione S-transferase N-terminal domain-containing protein n=1 Tax=Novispirillum sp. DQ9 TaxID=3398612 RepID=UPI003C7E995C